jgi:O-antigen ligase
MHSSLVAFLLGLGTRLQVQVIGYLPLTEIFVLLAAPLLLPKMTARATLAPTRWLVPLAVLWLTGTVMSDLYNQTDWSLAARGIARAIVLICCIPFCSWYMATDTWRKLFWFSVGLVPSVILSAYVLRGGVHEYRQWARGGVAEITWETHWCGLAYAICLVLVLWYYRSKPARGYLASLVTGALNIYMGSRSLGAVTILGAGVTFARNVVARRSTNAGGLVRRLSFGRAMPAIAIIGLVVFLVYVGYGSAASSNLLGTRAKLKYEAQSRSKYGILLGGRADVLAGLIAIQKNPIFGYGSWPLDRDGFYLQMCELMDEKPDKGYYTTGYPGIPTHSHIVQAWVQSGFLGGIFWIYVLYLLVLSLYKPILHESQLRLWASTVAMMAIWSVMFSPISDRFMVAMTLAVLLREMAAASSVARLSPSPVVAKSGSGSMRRLGYEAA